MQTHTLVNASGTRGGRWLAGGDSSARDGRRPAPAARRLRLAVAAAADRAALYRLRHDVYASELHQHAENALRQLSDPLDAGNDYLCVWEEDALVGFISITSPAAGRYSLDKYLPRAQWPFPCEATLYEVRLLTVVPTARGTEVAILLMYGALRWIEARGGTRLMAIGRREVLSLYRKAGLQGTGVLVTSGAVHFEVMDGCVAALRQNLTSYASILRRMEERVTWQLDMPFRPPAAAFHGGAFFTAIGERLDRLDSRRAVINADVLDAWFPPSPRVLAAVREHLPWLLATSPPTHAAGLVEVIAERRGVRPANILPGAGSSDLIFRAFRYWLARPSRALVLDPTYGEYPHVLEQVVGCAVDRLPLRREAQYRLDPSALSAALQRGYDLVVLVNPNSPTGQHVPREALAAALRAAPERTRVWVDETYVDYVGTDHSLESLALSTPNVIICKSMSKVYALSGARVAYLCAPAPQLEGLRGITPPWVVSLPAQLAAVEALQDPGYYAARYAETHALRATLARDLETLGWEVLPGCANFLLAHLPPAGPTAAWWVDACRARGLFVRNVASMSARFGDRVLRIAVKDAATNARMVGILTAIRAAAAGNGHGAEA